VKCRLTEFSPEDYSKLHARLATQGLLPDSGAIFTSPGWLTAWIETIGAGQQTASVVAEQDAEQVAYLPLVLRRRALREWALIGQPSVYADHWRPACDPVDARDFLHSALDCLDRQSAGWGSLRFASISADLAASIGEATNSPDKDRFSLIESGVAPYLDLSAGFDSILAGFSKKKRYNLKRTVRLAEEGGLRYEAPAEPPDELLDTLLKLHRRRAADRKIRSTFDEDAIAGFHRTFLRTADGRSHTWFRVLRHDDDIVAVFYGFRCNGALSFYQQGFDPDIGHLSPGSVLLYRVIEEACSSQISEFDFLQGDEAYKSQWTNSKRVLYEVTMFARSARGRTLRSIRHAREMAKKVLRR